MSVEPEILKYIRALQYAAEVNVLRNWEKAHLDGLEVFKYQAMEIAESGEVERPMAKTIGVVLDAWLDERRKVVLALRVRLRELNLAKIATAAVPSVIPHPLRTQPACGGPANGDVRSRFGALHVWLDDDWFLLGARQAP